MASSARPRLRLGDEERVKPLELYFDLIFVFAVTQVTGLIVEDPTWAGLVRGLVVLGVLWWAWTAYAWLTNTVDPDEGVVRITMFGAMGAMLVASLAVPDVFGDDAFLFACMYALVRIAHLVLYAFAGWGDRALLGALSRLGAGTAAGVGLLFVASALDGPLQAGVWALALALDLLGAYIGGGRGWRLSPAHFAERHALVMIIALGESIIAIGAGAPRELGVGVIAAGTLGIAIACTLWWAYFDVVALVAERKLHEAKGTAQLTMARDSYSYLHLPMVAGIVLYAVGVKKTMEHVGDPLKIVPAVALCGGLALYFVAHLLFRLRNVHSVNRQRLVVAVLLLGSLPLATRLPALATLALVAGLCIALVAYESLRFADARERVRNAPAPAESAS
jgi:low temperature requirement protein LtrA